jgi:hypothetical protein
VAAGKTSSLIMSSASQLIFLGKSSDFMENENMRSWDLFLVYGMNFLPVALKVEWNTKMECIFLKFIDTKQKGFKSKAHARRLQRKIFVEFSKKKECLMGYSDLLGKTLDVHFMGSKRSAESKKKTKGKKVDLWRKMHVTKKY